MADIGSGNKKIWNGMLSSWTENGYSAIVNFDIVPPSYHHYGMKHRPTSYYLKKRKSYSKILPEQFIGMWWEVTDYIELNKGWCNDDDCRWYMMLSNRNSWKMKVVTVDCNSFIWIDIEWNEKWWESDYNECFCDCQFDKFILTDFVRWTPRRLEINDVESTTGIQANIANGTVWVLYDNNTDISFTTVNVGDWVYVHWSPSWEWDAYCGQARQVVEKRAADWNIARPYLLLNAPWMYLWAKTIQEQMDEDIAIQTARNDLSLAISTGNQTEITNKQNILNALLSVKASETTNQTITTWVNGTYTIYPEWWEVIMYATCEWLKTIHALHGDRTNNTNVVVENFRANVTSACGSFMNDVCTYWVDVFNNRINILWSRGYNMAWGLWFNKMSFNVDNINYVWADKTSQTVFRNFLVQFGKDNMSVIVYNEDWNSFSYKLDSSMWIFSRTSFISYQNSLLFVGSDKRLYSADIGSNGHGGYVLSVTDQSAQIRWDLELLRDWDEVNMSADGKHLYVFINNKHHNMNTNNTKTRILKFYNDYNKWVYHDICCGVLKWKREDYYIGDSIYNHWQYTFDWVQASKDCGNTFVESYIEFYIWENEDMQTEFSTLWYKQLDWIKILLWKGIYTDWSTKIVIDSNVHWFKHQYQADTFEHIPWIGYHNQLRAWEVPEIRECNIEHLAECSNVVRACNGWQPATEWQIWVDNCICYDDKAYELADIYQVMLNTKHLKKTDIYRVRIISSGWDEMVFGWVLAQLEIFPFEKHDTDSEDLINNGEDCCIEWKYVDIYNPCWCSI